MNEKRENAVHPQDMPITRTMTIAGPDPVMEKAMQLAFAPVSTPSLIPRRCFERMQDRKFDARTIDRIYQLGTGAGTPTCLLYVLIDAQHEIHGFLWVQLDPFISELSIYAFAVDPEFQDGRWMNRVSRWLFAQPFDWRTLQPQIAWATDSTQRLVITKEVGADEVRSH